MASSLKYALVVPGWDSSGGVRRVGDFFLDLALASGFDVTVVSLSTSRSDAASSQIMRPKSWSRQGRITSRSGDPAYVHAGTSFAEIEYMRYLQRAELRTFLNDFDLVQVVAGTPAWANATRGISPPVVLQVATTTRWEREQRDAVPGRIERTYRRSMTRLVTHLDKRGSKVPSAVLVENAQMRHWMKSHASAQALVIQVPPGVDSDVFCLPTNGWNAQGPLISVGRLEESRKGWERLVSCYAALVLQLPDAPDLLLVGTGDPRATMLRLIDDLGLQNRVTVVSNCDDRTLVSLLQGSSMFVAAPYEEGLGLAALEGLACGLPVVVTETAGSREYVEPLSNGVLLSQTESTLADEFVSAVARVLVGGTTMSKNARASCERDFSVATSRSRILSLYRHLLGDGAF